MVVVRVRKASWTAVRASDVTGLLAPPWKYSRPPARGLQAFLSRTLPQRPQRYLSRFSFGRAGPNDKEEVGGLMAERPILTTSIPRADVPAFLVAILWSQGG
jgi:hypothetical protein